MSYFSKNPRARGAYFATWKKLWQKRLASGAVSEDEEEAERKAMLIEIAGTDSSSKLNEAEATAVMLAMDAELGPDAKSRVMDPTRARKIAKIGHLSKTLRPEDPESYVLAIVKSKFRVKVPEDWRQRLTRNEIHMLMIDLVEQVKRNERKVGKEAEESRSKGVEKGEV